MRSGVLATARDLSASEDGRLAGRRQMGAQDVKWDWEGTGENVGEIIFDLHQTTQQATAEGLRRLTAAALRCLFAHGLIASLEESQSS